MKDWKRIYKTKQILMQTKLNIMTIKNIGTPKEIKHEETTLQITRKGLRFCELQIVGCWITSTTHRAGQPLQMTSKIRSEKSVLLNAIMGHLAMHFAGDSAIV
jgi:hypothetical protein